MSQLTIYAENDPNTALLSTDDFAEISMALGNAGIRIERWSADREITDDMDDETIIAAYQAEIDRLVAEGGYQTWDVVSIHPDHPEKEAFRKSSWMNTRTARMKSGSSCAVRDCSSCT